MPHNLWDTAKVILRGRFIAIQSHLKKTRKISNKQSNLIPKATRERITKKTQSVSRRKEIIKIRAEINEIEMKKTIAKINKAKSWFFEKVNKIDKPIARLIKKKRERTQNNKIE